jgi:D-alanyl-D-alanine endopeptidase (penicillin-binding protein 7)
MNDSRPYKHFTILEWLVLFCAVFFLTISSAEAHTKRVKKSSNTKHKKHAVYNIPKRELSVMITDATDGKILCASNAEEIRALASITKLMTAMIAIDQDTNLNHTLPLIRKSGSHLPAREYTREELLHALLVKSDNGAAESFAHNYPGGRDAFLHEMNFRAKSMGMVNTNFDDPSGLSNKNVSTAKDITILVLAASQYEKIKEISTKREAYIQSYTKKKPRTLVLNNTNRMILSQVNGVQVSKTGFTNPAGFCVALLVEKIINNERHNQVYVVMGARNSKHRADEVKRLIYIQNGDTNYGTVRI